MNLLLPLIPDGSPEINLFLRTNDDDPPSTTPVNVSPITGTEVSNRPGHFIFDITAIADGDYIVVVDAPIATYYISKSSTKITIGEHWTELEQTTISISPQAFVNIPPSALKTNRLIFHNDEDIDITITRTDGEDFDGSLMDFVIELADKSTLVEVLGISSLTNSVVASVPATPYDDSPGKKWSLRVASTGQVLLTGPANMNYAPLKDTP